MIAFPKARIFTVGRNAEAIKTLTRYAGPDEVSTSMVSRVSDTWLFRSRLNGAGPTTQRRGHRVRTAVQGLGVFAVSVLDPG